MTTSDLLQSRPSRQETDWSMEIEAQATGNTSEQRQLDTRQMTVPLRFEVIEYRMNMLEMSTRKQAATMLLLGAMSGLSGFVFAFALGCLRASPALMHLGERSYCRKYDGTPLDVCYFPATVSEMVSNSQDPTGKIFFFFEFIGAILIFFSWYPQRLRTVFIGDDFMVAPILGVTLSWVQFRQYIPAPGMMMLAVITTVPFAQADLLDYFCISFHLIGAALMFVGYFLAEAVTIGWGPIKGVSAGKKHIHGGMGLRVLSLHVIVLSYLAFCALQVLFTVGSGDDFDQWKMLNETDCLAKYNVDCKLPQLVRAASWKVKWFKIISYGAEVVCGCALIFSHLVIWWYCEERHYDLPEEILHMDSHQQELSEELVAAMPRSFNLG